MSALYLLAAGLALPVMHDKLGRPRPDLRQVDLVLALRARQAHPTLAVGAPQWTVHREPLVDGLRDGAHRLLAIPSSRLAAWRLGAVFGRSLRKRSRLSFASPAQFLDQLLKLIDSALLPLDEALQLADAAQKLRVDFNQLLVT